MLAKMIDVCAEADGNRSNQDMEERIVVKSAGPWCPICLALFTDCPLNEAVENA
jgi:hypothetical protein